MKQLVIGIFVSFLCLHAAHGGDDTGSTAIFNTANATYDQGDFAGALEHYRELLKRSPGSTEVWYNAANAAFRSGRVGEAILYYRRAWYLSPRDPDVRANLQLAQQRTGARVPERSLLDHATQEFSHHEWKRFFTVSYSTFIIAAAVMILFSPVRRFVKPVLVLSLIAALTTLAGWWQWRQWLGTTEAVIIAGQQTARYEPRTEATPFFELPEGSIVYIEGTFDQWQKVRAGDKAGWIPGSSLQRVDAWQSPVLN